MRSLETYCESRNNPLLVGCVKSNLGHTEATSGLCSIAKVIIAAESGFIPPNLHYHNPQSGIEVLQNGKIKVRKYRHLLSAGLTPRTNWAECSGVLVSEIQKKKTKKMFILITQILSWLFQWSYCIFSRRIILSVRPRGKFPIIFRKLLWHFEINW